MGHLGHPTEKFEKNLYFQYTAERKEAYSAAGPFRKALSWHVVVHLHNTVKIQPFYKKKTSTIFYDPASEKADIRPQKPLHRPPPSAGFHPRGDSVPCPEKLFLEKRVRPTLFVLFITRQPFFRDRFASRREYDTQSHISAHPHLLGRQRLGDIVYGIVMAGGLSFTPT